MVFDEDIGKDDLVGEIFLNVDDLFQVGEVIDTLKDKQLDMSEGRAPIWP